MVVSVLMSEWLKSGHASYEAKIFTDDLAMIQDIKQNWSEVIQ